MLNDDGAVGTAEAAEAGDVPRRSIGPLRPEDLRGEWDVGGSPPTSRRWLLLAAVVPWGVLAALLLRTGEPVRGGVPDVAPTPRPSPSAPPDEPEPQGMAPVGGALAATAPPAPGVGSSDASPTVMVDRLSSGARTSRRAADAIGIAIAVARVHLSTLPAGGAVDGIGTAPGAGGHYVEHLTVEGLDHPGPDLVVVVVVAVVLPVDDDGYGAPQLRRVAVPVRLDDGGASPAGPPWPLEPPRLDPRPPTPEPVEDETLTREAADALGRAGYADVRIDRLAATASWPWIADIEARAPGEDAPRDHRVWLRTHLDGLVVAGTVPVHDPATVDEQDPS